MSDKSSLQRTGLLVAAVDLFFLLGSQAFALVAAQ